MESCEKWLKRSELQPLAKQGYNRDKKKEKLQIKYGLICDVEGRPLAIEVFEGHTSDPQTLSHQIEKVKHKFKLSKIIFVADRGIITQARINEGLSIVGWDWISALTSKSITQLIKNKTLIPSNYEEENLAEIKDPSYPGEHLIICLNKALQKERRRTREDLLQATERELNEIVQATRRTHNPLKGIKEISLRVGKMRNKYKVGKH